MQPLKIFLIFISSFPLSIIASDQKHGCTTTQESNRENLLALAVPATVQRIWKHTEKNGDMLNLLTESAANTSLLICNQDDVMDKYSRSLERIETDLNSLKSDVRETKDLLHATRTEIERNFQKIFDLLQLKNQNPT